MNTLKDQQRKEAERLLKLGQGSLRTIARRSGINVNTAMSLRNRLVEQGELNAGAFAKQRKEHRS